MNRDNGLQTPNLPFNVGGANGRLAIPSNVTRICRATRTESSSGTTQVVYYQAGVGTGLGPYDRIVGGATGLGLSENIREAYDFLAHNYVPGDQIVLLGYSRGAFTARSIAGLVGTIGVLTKKGLADFYEIFKDYENARDPAYRPAQPDVPFPGKGNVRDPGYRAELKRVSVRLRAGWAGGLRGVRVRG